MPSDDLTQERLRELVHYDPETGIFTTKVARSNVPAGKRLGTLHHSGYFYSMILGRRLALHRLAFIYMTGRCPKEVDHRNGDRADTRWANLREATRSQNKMNSGVVLSKTGFKGVTKLRPSKDGTPRYMAQMKFQGRPIYLGVFRTPEEAYAAYVAGARRLHGEFLHHTLQYGATWGEM